MVFKHRHDRPPPAESDPESDHDSTLPTWMVWASAGLLATILLGALILLVWPHGDTPAGEATITPPTTTTAQAAPLPVHITLAPLRPYQDPEGRFTIPLPESWEQEPKPPPVLVFRPPGAGSLYGRILVNISEFSRRLNQSESISILNDYVKLNFGDLEGFTISEPPDTAQPRLQMRFSYRLVSTDGAPIRTMRGVAWIDQGVQRVSIAVIEIPDDQHTELAPTIDAIQAGYQLP